MDQVSRVKPFNINFGKQEALAYAQK